MRTVLDVYEFRTNKIRINSNSITIAVAKTRHNAENYRGFHQTQCSVSMICDIHETVLKLYC